MPIAPTSTSRVKPRGAIVAISAAIHPPNPSPTSVTSLKVEIGEQRLVHRPRCRARCASSPAEPTDRSPGAMGARHVEMLGQLLVEREPAQDCRCRDATPAADRLCRRAGDGSGFQPSRRIAPCTSTPMPLPYSLAFPGNCPAVAANNRPIIAGCLRILERAILATARARGGGQRGNRHDRHGASSGRTAWLHPDARAPVSRSDQRYLDQQ